MTEPTDNRRIDKPHIVQFPGVDTTAAKSNRRAGVGADAVGTISINTPVDVPDERSPFLKRLFASVPRDQGLEILLGGDEILKELVEKAKNTKLNATERQEANTELIENLKTKPSLLNTILEKGRKILAQAGLAGGLIAGSSIAALTNHYNTEALNHNLELLERPAHERRLSKDAPELRFNNSFDARLHRDKIDPALCILLGLGIAGAGLAAQEAAKDSKTKSA